MPSPLQQAKLANQFRLLDTDGDGCVGHDDYLAAAGRIGEAFDVDPASPAAQALRQSFVALFEGTGVVGDGNGDVDHDRVTLAGFGRRMTPDRDAEWFRATVLGLASALVTACDVDGDEELSGEELRTLLTAWGTPPDATEVAFRHLDLDLSGHLSAPELSDALEEFFVSDDPHAPGNWLFGPVDGAVATQATSAPTDGAAPAGVRIAYPDPATLPAESQQILAALPQLNIFRTVEASAESCEIRHLLPKFRSGAQGGNGFDG